MSANDSIRDFVISVGRGLKRPREEVEPYVQTLEDNWFDSPASLVDTKPEELSALGIPLRFAKELLSNAEKGGSSSRGPPSASSGGADKDRGKGKDKGKKGKGKGKEKGKDKDKGRSRDASGAYEETLDVEPCDADFGLRAKLVGDRGGNVHHIQDQCKASVSVDREASSVHISADSPDALDKAVGMTSDLINTVMVDYAEWQRANDHNSRKAGKGKDKDKGKGKADRKGKGKGKDKHDSKDSGRDRARDDADSLPFTEVLELEFTEPDFRIKGQIIGKHGKNMKHIQDQSGAKIHVEESGASVTISANSQEDLDNALRMTQDLVGTTMEDYDVWLQERQSQAPEETGGRTSEKDGKGKRKSNSSGKGKDKEGKGGGKDRGSRHGGDGEFTEVIQLEETDARFNIKGQIIGEKGKNIHHIQDQTRAKLNLDRDNRLHISASSQEALDEAVSMANDLIGAVLDDYDQWCGQQAAAAEEDTGSRSGKSDRKGGKDKGKGKGKSKSKGKDRGKDYDHGRPAKRYKTD